MSANSLNSHNNSPQPLAVLDDELPELSDADLQRADAVWTVNGTLVTPAVGKMAFGVALKKQKINITLDPDVLSWYKSQAMGRGYQTLINATLREAMRAKDIETTLRRVIREELRREPAALFSESLQRGG